MINTEDIRFLTLGLHVSFSETREAKTQKGSEVAYLLYIAIYIPIAITTYPHLPIAHHRPPPSSSTIAYHHLSSCIIAYPSTS